MTDGVPLEREQNFYPLSHLPIFRQLIDEQLEHEQEQLASLQQAESRPYILDDATVNRVIKLYSEAPEIVGATGTTTRTLSNSDFETSQKF